MFLDILQWKNAFLDYKNNKFKKVEKLWFFERDSPWFWSKICNFSFFYILGKRRQQNQFHDIIERKKRLSSLKKKPKLRKDEKLSFNQQG